MLCVAVWVEFGWEICPVGVKSGLEWVQTWCCDDSLWQGIPSVCNSLSEEITSDVCLVVVFCNFQGVCSGLCTAERKLRSLCLIYTVYIFVRINHIASFSSMFKTRELQCSETFWVRFILECRQQRESGEVVEREVVESGRRREVVDLFFYHFSHGMSSKQYGQHF